MWPKLFATITVTVNQFLVLPSAKGTFLTCPQISCLIWQSYQGGTTLHVGYNMNDMVLYLLRYLSFKLKLFVARM